MTIIKCDRCGKTLKEENALVLEITDDYGVQWDGYDLCKACYMDVVAFLRKKVPEQPEVKRL